jgi:hypothetical protein
MLCIPHALHLLQTELLNESEYCTALLCLRVRSMAFLLWLFMNCNNMLSGVRSATFDAGSLSKQKVLAN